MQMRDEVLWSVGAQDMDTSGEQVSGLADNEFFWEKIRLNVDAVLRTEIETSFSSTAFD